MRAWLLLGLPEVIAVESVQAAYTLPPKGPVPWSAAADT